VNAELEAQKAGDVATLKEAATLVTGKDYRDKPESPWAHGPGDDVPSDGPLHRRGGWRGDGGARRPGNHPHYAKYEHTKDAATTR